MRRISVWAMTVVLGACGAAATPTFTGTIVPATGTATPLSSAASTAAATVALPTASAPPQLSDVLKAGKLTSYKVTYKWTVASGGQTQTSEQTWYYKSPRARFDFSVGPGATFSVYTLEDGTYVCTTGGGPAFCQKSPAGGGLDTNPVAAFDLQLQEHPERFNATFQGTRSIAGQSGQCYGIKGTGVEVGDVTSCYSATGVPLLTKMTSQGQEVTMEATAFSATVSDADFKLPAAAN